MRQIRNWNEKWAFTKNTEQSPQELHGQIPKTWDFVNLPHTWNNIDGQDGGGDYYRGLCYYAKKLQREELPKGMRHFLEIGAANAVAEVYVNGEKIAYHEGGYSLFRVEITNLLEKENLIVISVDNQEKGNVYPQMADFTFYGGLYRHVNLISVPDSHFALEPYGTPGIQVTPMIQEGKCLVEIGTSLVQGKSGQQLRYLILDREGEEVAIQNLPLEESEKQEVEAPLEIANPHLWQGVKDPYLYQAKAQLWQGEELLDEVTTAFGCRSFYLDSDKGFFLNGEPYPLRGVSRHQDRWGIGNALLPEHHREDMDLIMEVGANTIRLAHYQHAPYFYQLCDEKGIVVWAEIPYISKHVPEGRENTFQQMKELIVQNYNHPSIAFWGLSNEITMSGSDQDMVENHRELNDLVHQMDATRLTVIACVTMCDTYDPYLMIPEAVAYNHYFGWYGGDTSMNGPWFDKFHREHPHIPIGVSEYGCEALNWHTSDPKQGDYTEEYQAYYHEELIKQLFTRDYLWCTYVWNMFDFGADARNEGGENGQNHKGLVTFDRKYKKDAFYAYKAWLSKEPFVHICGKRYDRRTEDVTKVTVYSNQPKVELYANGKSLGVQESSDHFFYFQVPNQGETQLLALAGECQDVSMIRKVDTFPEEYLLKEKGAVLNWFDVTAPEGFFSLNDTLRDILETQEGKEVFAGLMQQMQKEMGGNMGGFAMNENMQQMMNGFTVLRLTGLMGTAGVHFTKEQLLEVNKLLNRIPKPTRM